MFSLTLAVSALAAISVRAVAATDVFAHFMVQNAYAYNQAQWKFDMQQAQSIGIDASP